MKFISAATVVTERRQRQRCCGGRPMDYNPRELSPWAESVLNSNDQEW